MCWYPQLSKVKIGGKSGGKSGGEISRRFFSQIWENWRNLIENLTEINHKFDECAGTPNSLTT